MGKVDEILDNWSYGRGGERTGLLINQWELGVVKTAFLEPTRGDVKVETFPYNRLISTIPTTSNIHLEDGGNTFFRNFGALRH
jgi:hypothetical protein